jgi:hypothetical protein
MLSCHILVYFPCFDTAARPNDKSGPVSETVWTISLW